MINIDALNDDEKLAALESIHKSIAESKEIQKKKITTNVELIVKALKKIESDLKQRYDETGQLIANLKNGEDGRDGKDGKDGKNGRDGRDGPVGPRGYDGLPGRNGIDGADGVSVTDAHIDFDGSLIISLSSGRVINVGEVVAADIAEKIKVITNGGGTSQGVLDAIASLQAQIDSIASGLEYQGTWNASTNVPTLTSSVGTAGYYYIVATAGSTNLNGVTDWQVGDWALFNGSIWQKLDQTNLVTSVAGRTGAITLTTADIGGLGTIATQAASNVSITGGSITGITDLAIADGGTGKSTAAAAITALTGTQTTGYYLRSNGTNAVLSAIIASDVPTLNQSTTGSAGSLSTTLVTSSGGTGLTTFTNKGVLYASSTNALATGTALQFDGTNFGMGATPSAWATDFRSIEIGAKASLTYDSNAKNTRLSTNIYNILNLGRPYYKTNDFATEYSQNLGTHSWSTAPSGIAGPTTAITTGKMYTNSSAGNQADFGAPDGLVGTVWTATSSGTLSSGAVIQNVDYVESMRIDTSGNVGIGIINPGSKLNVKGTLRLSGSTSGYVGLAPAAAAGSTTYILPSADGTSGQSLVTDGSGTLSWASGTGGTVTSVAASVPSFLSIDGSPITSSGTLAITLSGTALPTTSGGTGLTSFTSGGVVYASSTSALATGSALTFDGTTLGVSNGSAGSAGISITGTYSASGTVAFLNFQRAGGAVAGTLGYNDASTAIQFGTTTNHSTIFLQNNAEAMRLTSTGLGIGTTSPAAKLHVQATQASMNLRSTGTGNPYIDFYTSTSSLVGNIYGINGGGIALGTTDGTERMRLDASGNLGLGVTPSPWGTYNGVLDLKGNGALAAFNQSVNLSANTYYNGTGFIYKATTTAGYYQIAGNVHQWNIAPSGLANTTTIVSGGVYAVFALGSSTLAQWQAFFSGLSALPTVGQSITATASGTLVGGGTVSQSITFTQAMTLDASGNLGVGTTNPLSKLNAKGTQGNWRIDPDSVSSEIQLLSTTVANDAFRDYRIRTQQTMFDTAGAERMRIDSSGNVGIGTSIAPGSNGGGLAIYRSDYPRLTFRNNTTGDTTTAGTQFVAAGLNFEIYNKQSGYIDFGTGNTSRMLLDSSGNLGLGVTPSAWSGVNGVFEIKGNAYIYSTTGVLSSGANAYFNGTNWIYKTTQSATRYEQVNGLHRWDISPSGTAGNAITFTQAMTLDASGNLGIGTTSPSARLDVTVAGTASYSSSSAPTPNIFLGTTGAANSRYTSIGINCRGASGQSQTNYITSVPEATDGNAALAFSVYGGYAAVERARIDSSGNLLVGTTGLPNGTSVYGTALSPQSNGRTIIYQATNQTTSQTLQAFYNPNGGVGSISTSGSATSFTTSSDYRLKNTIAPMTGALAKVALLKPCTYKWNADGSNGEGFIAHELAEVMPQAVVGEKDAVDAEGKPVYQGIDTSFLVATLTAALQEAVAEINSLKARLDAANL
jgi:hypothetical protein